MPVNAASHHVFTLVLTLQGLFKENRPELGVCFRLHNMVVGYHMQKHQQGIYSLLLVPWLRALRGATLDAQQLLQLHKSHRWEGNLTCQWDLLRKFAFHILVVCDLLEILGFQYYPHHFKAESSPYYKSLFIQQAACFSYSCIKVDYLTAIHVLPSGLNFHLTGITAISISSFLGASFLWERNAEEIFLIILSP